jgi:hypothetical protein
MSASPGVPLRAKGETAQDLGGMLDALINGLGVCRAQRGEDAGIVRAGVRGIGDLHHQRRRYQPEPARTPAFFDQARQRFHPCRLMAVMDRSRSRVRLQVPAELLAACRHGRGAQVGR